MQYKFTNFHITLISQYTCVSASSKNLRKLRCLISKVVRTLETLPVSKTEKTESLFYTIRYEVKILEIKNDLYMTNVNTTAYDTQH